MRLPVVSRDRYDDLQRRYDALAVRYHELKLAGAVAPMAPRKGTVTPPAPTPEAVAEQRALAATLEQATDFLAAQRGIPRAQAAAEVQRLRAAVFGTDGAPR